MLIANKIKLHNEDCVAAMRKMSDKTFDLAIVDPPYGIGFSMEKERKKTATRSAQFKFKCKKWDNYIPPKEYFDQLFRISKNQIIWGGNYFLNYLRSTSCVIIWDKLNADGMRFSDGEMAWGSFDSSLRIFKSYRTYKHETQIHPTQKPVALYHWLLKKYANPGDKILDTHLGSGSLAVACYDAQLEFVGYEIDEEYFQAAVERIKKHMKTEKRSFGLAKQKLEIKKFFG